MSDKANAKANKSYTNWIHKETKKELPKVVESDDVILQNKVDYDIMGMKGIVPSKATATNVKIIAGKDSSTNIRDRYKIAKEFGIDPDNINKKVGTVQSKYYNYEIHWYESDGKQYRLKVKNKPKERK